LLAARDLLFVNGCAFLRAPKAHALALLMFAASCGGGHAGTAPPVPAKAVGAEQKGTAVFRIAIPKKAASSRTRRPTYVSPATQAMTVAITGPTTVNQTVALTPTSGGCASTLASTQCTLQVALAPGSYTATLTTYDGYNAGTQTATGNVLSTGQNIAFTLLAGQANTIAIALSGIPVQLVLTPLTPLTTANGSASYHLVGAGKHPFLVAALDADGNVIVGSGAPTFTIAAPTGALTASAVQPTTASPNQFSFIPPTTFGTGTATFAVAATYAGQPTDGCAQPGAACGPVNVVIDMVRAIVVANCGTSPPGALSPCPGGADSIAIYADGGASPLQTITGAAISSPQNVVADTAGNIFVYNAGFGTLGGTTQEFLAPTFTPGPTINSRGGTMAIAGDGTLYLADRYNNSDLINVYRPPYTGPPVASWDPASGSFAIPEAMVIAPNGDLWVDDSYNAQIWKYSAPVNGTPSPTVTLTQTQFPFSIALDPSGNLFAGAWHYGVDMYPAPIANSTFTIITKSPWMMRALVSDNAGNLYAMAYSTSSSTPPTALFALPAGSTTWSAPIQIAAADQTVVGSGASGAGVLSFLGLGAGGIYVTNRAGNSIDEFNFGLTAKIYSITTGINHPYAFTIEP
jgi:hypothetical protein